MGVRWGWGVGGNEGMRTGKTEIILQNSRQWAKHSKLSSERLPALKGQSLTALHSHQEGTKTSASMAPH